jgi:hypothetical protein
MATMPKQPPNPANPPVDRLWSEDELDALHKHSFLNREEVESSTVCGCYHCLRIFPPTDFTADDWVAEAPDRHTGIVGDTGWCPHCGFDTVIGSAAGEPITPALLRALNDHCLYGIVAPDMRAIAVIDLDEEM